MLTVEVIVVFLEFELKSSAAVNSILLLSAVTITSSTAEILVILVFAVSPIFTSPPPVECKSILLFECIKVSNAPVIVISPEVVVIAAFPELNVIVVGISNVKLVSPGVEFPVILKVVSAPTNSLLIAYLAAPEPE